MKPLTRDLDGFEFILNESLLDKLRVLFDYGMDPNYFRINSNLKRDPTVKQYLLDYEYDKYIPVPGIIEKRLPLHHFLVNFWTPPDIAVVNDKRTQLYLQIIELFCQYDVDLLLPSDILISTSYYNQMDITSKLLSIDFDTIVIRNISLAELRFDPTVCQMMNNYFQARTKLATRPIRYQYLHLINEYALTIDQLTVPLDRKQLLQHRKALTPSMSFEDALLTTRSWKMICGFYRDETHHLNMDQRRILILLCYADITSYYHYLAFDLINYLLEFVQDY
jgi:hypothetical protein